MASFKSSVQNFPESNGKFKPRMDANQRECLDEHLIRVDSRPFAVKNNASSLAFVSNDFL